MIKTGQCQPMTVRLPAHRCTPATAEELKTILAAHPGPRPVQLLLVTGGRTLTVALDAASVTDSPALRRDLHTLTGHPVG